MRASRVMLACMALALAAGPTACGREQGGVPGLETTSVALPDTDTVRAPAHVSGDSLTRIALEKRGFRLGGLLLDAARNEPAGAIVALRHAANADTERFVIALGTGGVGHARVEFMRDLGILRVRLPQVTATAKSDTVFAGRLAGQCYVVRAADRSLYVDLHLWAPAFARATVLAGPPRVVVDLVPGGPQLIQPAARARNVVVLTPRPGPASYPLRVFGYARTFEANVIGRVFRPGEVTQTAVTTATDWSETWGEFVLVIQGGPKGSATLFVGEESAKDGSEQGVRINLLLLR